MSHAYQKKAAALIRERLADDSIWEMDALVNACEGGLWDGCASYARDRQSAIWRAIGDAIASREMQYLGHGQVKRGAA